MKLPLLPTGLFKSFSLAGTLIALIGTVSYQSIRTEAEAVQAPAYPLAAEESGRMLSDSSLLESVTDAWKNQPLTLPIQAREIGISREGTSVVVLTASAPNRSSSAGGGCLEVWSTHTQERLFSLPAAESTQFEAVAISDDGSKVAAIVQDRDHSLSLWIWDINSEQAPTHERLESSRPIFGPFTSGAEHRFAAVSSAIAFSPDGTQLVTNVTRLSDQAEDNMQAQLQLHTTTGEILQTLALPASTQIERIAFSPDGKQLVGAGRTILESANRQADASTVVNLWQTKDGQLVSSFNPNDAIAASDGIASELGYISAVTFTPSGQLKTLSNINLTSDQLVTWELSTPVVARQTQTLLEVDRQDFIHVLSPDGIYHFMRGDVGGTRLLNTHTLEVIQINERVSEATFSAEGDYLAIATPETVQIFSKGSR